MICPELLHHVTKCALNNSVALTPASSPNTPKDWQLYAPTNRTVLRRKELKLQPPAFMLPSDFGQVFSLDCMQYIKPSPIIICRQRERKKRRIKDMESFFVTLQTTKRVNEKEKDLKSLNLSLSDTRYCDRWETMHCRANGAKVLSNSDHFQSE